MERNDATEYFNPKTGITGAVAIDTADGWRWYFADFKWLGKEHCTALLFKKEPACDLG